MNVLVSSMLQDLNPEFNYFKYVFEIQFLPNGTRFVLKTSETLNLDPNEPIPFDEFALMYRKELQKNFYLNHYT